MYLLDTNIVSELRKRVRCDENVTAWYARISDDELFLSVLTLVTRNVVHFRDLGVNTLNPFSPRTGGK